MYLYITVCLTGDEEEKIKCDMNGDLKWAIHEPWTYGGLFVKLIIKEYQSTD